MDKVAKGMTQASPNAGQSKGKGLAQSLKDLANKAVCKVKDYVNQKSHRPVKR